MTWWVFRGARVLQLQECQLEAKSNAATILIMREECANDASKGRHTSRKVGKALSVRADRTINGTKSLSFHAPFAVSPTICPIRRA